MVITYYLLGDERRNHSQQASLYNNLFEYTPTLLKAFLKDYIQVKHTNPCLSSGFNVVLMLRPLSTDPLIIQFSQLIYPTGIMWPEENQMGCVHETENQHNVTIGDRRDIFYFGYNFSDTTTYSSILEKLYILNGEFYSQNKPCTIWSFTYNKLFNGTFNCLKD